MKGSDKQNYQAMLARYERLKKMYFRRGRRNEFDDDGQEMPGLIDRGAIVNMFQNMGVELPLAPNDPMTPIGQAQDQDD